MGIKKVGIHIGADLSYYYSKITLLRLNQSQSDD